MSSKSLMECHDEATAKAGLNLENLSNKFLTEPSEEWIEIMDAESRPGIIDF